MYRSAIILGIIGVQEPESLSRTIKKHVAESLVALLLDGKRNIFRLAAVELMGRGYSIWLPFIHGASIFKLLYSWLIQLYGGDEQFYQITLKAIIHILSTSEIQYNILPVDSGCSLTSSPSVSRKSSSSALSKTKPLITWLIDLHGSREVTLIERKCSIELIKNLLSFKPIVFQGHEYLLVEILMKLLEPGQYSMYEELTSQFGVISFHTASQRLAVSLPDNSIVIYDLKTGNRINHLQGHVHTCTLVAFNSERSDGKQLISYSVGEACVRWWNVSLSSSSGTGFFSSFTSQNSENSSDSYRPGVKPVKIVIVQPELTEAIDCIPSGSVFKLNPINLNWNVMGKIVEFRVGALLIQTLPIPNL
jgi:WD40 repeat protein